jgi:AcrR family transcriptional regulator
VSRTAGAAPAAFLVPAGEVDAASARGRLLDAAERLFAERGYSATSVREITSGAGCNVAAVNYHFGGKLRLYRAVFDRRLRALREARIARRTRALEEAGGRASLETVLRAFTVAFLEPHLDLSSGRRLTLLISREVLDPRLPPGTFEREMLEPLRRVLARALRRTCPGLDARAARRCFHSLLAQLIHAVKLRHARPARGADRRGDLELPDAADHIVRFTAAGIRGCAP